MVHYTLNSAGLNNTVMFFAIDFGSRSISAALRNLLDNLNILQLHVFTISSTFSSVSDKYFFGAVVVALATIKPNWSQQHSARLMAQ